MSKPDLIRKNEISNHIQYIRAIAVSLVVLYHAQVQGFKNGWIGVDIFLVISGYLMQAIFVEHIKEFGIISFYIRRFKRLLPALIVSSLVFFCLLFLKFLPFERSNLSKEFFAAISGNSNIFYYLGDQYFEHTQLRPFLNLWSIALELQYYLIFPIILLLFRSKKVAITLFVPVILLGFVLSILSEKSAFFLIPGRLWEFFLGQLAFVYAAKISNKRNFTYFYAAIFAAIIIFGLNQNLDLISHFAYQILIAVATANLLVNGKSKNKESIAQRLFVSLGNYSYSIYLVHFPLLILLFYKPFSGNIVKFESNVRLMAYLFILVLFAFILKKYIEDPFRGKRINLRTVYTTFFVLFVLVFASMQSLVANFGYSKVEVNIQAASSDKTPFRCGWISRTDMFYDGAKVCSISENAKNNESILLAGNSHADSIKYAVANSFENYNTFLLNERSAIGPDNYSSYLKGLKSKKFKHLIYSSRAGSTDYRYLEKLTNLAKQSGVSVIIIEPFPEAPDSVPQAMWNQRENLKSFQFDKSSSSETYLGMNRLELAKIQRLSGGNTQILQVYDLFCKPECEFFSKVNFRPYYFDSNHLTITGAQLIENRLRSLRDQISLGDLEPVG